MAIGVVSDTHGNRVLMHQAISLMTRHLGVDLLFHLGDDYADGEELKALGYDVRVVPGLWCDEYHDGRIRKYWTETIDGIDVAAVHAEKDLPAAARSASIILTGHTHRARIEWIGHTLYVNPGHLKAASSRGERASFATIRIEDGTVEAAIHETNGEVRQRVCVETDQLAHD